MKNRPKLNSDQSSGYFGAEVGQRALLRKSWLIAIGAACFVMVALTHVAEAFHIFPALGWGMPNSPGHYLDLVSAILGCILLSLGLGAWWGKFFHHHLR
jgi:succinate dehydrogenase/fumarate reductase cytochrome b subunit